MKWVPRITYDGGSTELVLSLPQRLWEPEEGVGYGDEDESAAGIMVAYVVRYDYAVRVFIRFTDSERITVMTMIEWVLKHKTEAILFRFDQDDLATEYSVYVEDPRIGDRVKPERNPQDPAAWEVSMLLRSSTGDRIYLPYLD